MPEKRLERTRKNYDDPDKGKPIAQQQCKDCGEYACLVPFPHGETTESVPSVAWRSRHYYDTEGRLVIPFPRWERVLPQADGDGAMPKPVLGIAGTHVARVSRRKRAQTGSTTH